MTAILMLLENCAYPGDDRVRREARSLVEGGYQVTVIAPSSEGQPWKETIGGVHVYRFPSPPHANGFIGYLWEYGYSMVAVFALSLFVFLVEGFDVIHAHQPPDMFAFIAGFYKLFGKKYVFDHHDLAPELYFARFGGIGNRSIYHILLWFEKMAFRLADHVISTNESYKNIAIQRGKKDEYRITIVRNGPDLNELCSKDRFDEIRKNGKKVVGYVGVTGMQDGVDSLIFAMNHIVCDLKRTDILCVVLGTGSAMPLLQSLVKQLKLEPYILLKGWIDKQEEVAKYMNTMDICVAPEPSDPYNDRSTAAKVMEYMAMGKPVVSSNLPEHRHTAGKAALYAKPGDSFDYAEKIVTLIDDPAQRERLGRIGRDRVQAKLAWSHQARKLVKAYDRLFDGV